MLVNQRAIILPASKRLLGPQPTAFIFSIELTPDPYRLIDHCELGTVRQAGVAENDRHVLTDHRLFSIKRTLLRDASHGGVCLLTFELKPRPVRDVAPESNGYAAPARSIENCILYTANSTPGALEAAS